MVTIQSSVFSKKLDNFMDKCYNMATLGRASAMDKKILEHSIHIGELCKAFGLTKQTIEHWASLGMVHREQNPENGYYQYTIKSINDVVNIIALKNMRMSLKEISNIDKLTYGQMIELYNRKHIEIDHEMNNLKNAANTIDEQLRTLNYLHDYRKSVAKVSPPKFNTIIPYDNVMDTMLNNMRSQEQTQDISIWKNADLKSSPDWGLGIDNNDNQLALWNKRDDLDYYLFVASALKPTKQIINYPTIRDLFTYNRLPWEPDGEYYRNVDEIIRQFELHGIKTMEIISCYDATITDDDGKTTYHYFSYWLGVERHDS